MSVNGIEIQVGQRWRRRDGSERVLCRIMDDETLYGVRDAEGATYTCRGEFYHGQPMHAFNLIELVAAGDSVQATTFGPLAGVGDINSDAKGSGARYNTGKTPYELIPVGLMGEFYDEDDGSARAAAAKALKCLGNWQAGGDANDLMAALMCLGGGGWEECAVVFDYGRNKYAAWNWAKGMAWSIPLGCATRHLLKIIHGEADDVESGKPHRGHAFCNIVMLLVYSVTFIEGDDRPKTLASIAIDRKKPDDTEGGAA